MQKFFGRAVVRLCVDVVILTFFSRFSPIVGRRKNILHQPPQLALRNNRGWTLIGLTYCLILQTLTPGPWLIRTQSKTPHECVSSVFGVDHWISTRSITITGTTEFELRLGHQQKVCRKDKLNKPHDLLFRGYTRVGWSIRFDRGKQSPPKSIGALRFSPTLRESYKGAQINTPVL